MTLAHKLKLLVELVYYYRSKEENKLIKIISELLFLRESVFKCTTGGKGLIASVCLTSIVKAPVAFNHDSKGKREIRRLHD